MSGLFDTFNIALRGLNVQQSAINTTSHNIANADTVGYSRQRSVAETTKPSGGMSRFDTSGAGQVGTGAQITSIQRIRDSFIDYQVRSETGTSSYYSTTSDTLSKVEDVFGEPSDTGIQELTSKFYSAFQEVSKSPDKSDVKTVAIQNASSLADAINYAYNQLKKTCEDTQTVLQTNVTDVNSYLDQINDLNKQIRGVSAVGQTPNDLMDKRDNLLDELSSKFGIKIDKDTLETINVSSTEYPDSALVKSNPNDTNYTRLSYVKSATAVNDGAIPPVYTGEVTVEYYPLGNENSATKTFTIASDGTANAISNAKELADNLNQNRILLGDKDGIVSNITTSTPITIPVSSLPITIPSSSSGPVDNGDGTTTQTTTTVKGLITTITKTTAPKTATIPITTTITTINFSDTTTQSSATEVTTTTGAPNTVSDLKAKVFKTYEYESGVNNVDNNHVKGDIASNQSVQEKIQGYMDNLDRLAAALAYSVNAIQTANTDGSSTAASSQGLSKNLIFTNAGNTDTDTGITAATIKINSALVTDPTLLNCNTTSTSGEGDGKRAAAIANLNVLKMNLSSIGSTVDLTTTTREEFLNDAGIGTSGTDGFSDTSCLNLSSGTEGSTVDSYYKTIINNLAVANQEATRISGNQDTILAKLQDDKSAVSGVSLDEEMTNLIQFQHAYQANAKMISTIDELLDVVINGLKV